MNIRPDFAKRKSTCHYCKEEIKHGSEIVRVAHRLRNPKFWRKHVVHLACHVESLFDYFNTHRYKPAQRPRRAVVLPEDREAYKRLQANIRYHRHVGNLDRVEELEQEAIIMRLRRGNG